ncbi:GNAT family N-acetyltransferase [Skermanella pratensis]|uniref:GNAT family N-acetyltransferase n=1 Tax=Skermanella pratensis TaxID=2233999 RepID=UPI0017883A38|nr:GNAT family N-acetyltransferase [Skermanella pratensis]
MDPATSADLDDLLNLLNTPGVRRYLCDDTEVTREHAGVLLAGSVASWPDGLGLWTIRTHDGARLGYGGLGPVSSTAAAAAPRFAGAIEPVIALAPEHWGLGYATEALAAIVTHAFGTLALKRLVALVDEPNIASHRLVSRLGFVPGIMVAGPRHRLRTYILAPPTSGSAARKGGIAPVSRPRPTRS